MKSLGSVWLWRCIKRDDEGDDEDNDDEGDDDDGDEDANGDANAAGSVSCMSILEENRAQP